MGKKSELSEELWSVRNHSLAIAAVLEAERARSTERGIRHTFTIETSGKWGSAANLSVCEAIERLCRALESGGLTVHRSSRHYHNENTDDTTYHEFPRRDIPSGCACRIVGNGSNSR